MTGGYGMVGNRPADWHVLDLDKDPTPGDPDRVRNLAKNLHDFADDVSKVLRDIKGMAGEDAILTWAGKTAESFTAEFEDAPGKLKKLKKSYEMAGDALSTYWPELERSQALADKALAKGREAQTSLSAAQTRLTSADSWVDKAGKEADKYKDDGGSKDKDVPKPDPDKVKAASRNATSAEKAQTAAKSDVTAAQSNLDAAKKMAEDARKMREDAAGTAKKKLEEASDAGIQNRKWWEEVGDWVTDNWDTIVAVCKVVVAVLGVIAMIIGGPILAAIVVVAALVVLADTLSKYAKGEAGLLDVAFAALDCIPGMKGLTSLRGLAKGMKALGRTGLRGMARGLRRNSGDVLQRARRRPRNGPPMPMTMDSVQQISGRYGVDLVGIRVNINRGVSGIQGSTPSAREIRLYRDAFYDEETLARTLAHERFHVQQIREGGRIPTTQAELDRWEDGAYAYEDEWWKNHPVNKPAEEGEPNGQ
ncbi:putative T7SS-secreted protein [Streptomyces sp. NPDC055189]